MLKSNLSIDLNYNLDEFAIKGLFRPIISKFLHFQIGTIEDFRILEAEVYISSHDFKNSQNHPMEYIYLNFLDGINRIKKYLDIPISVFITFDKRQCPNYCKHSNRYFSSIKVGGISKVYYILFTTDELFDFLYSKEVGYVEEVKISTAYFDSDLKDYSYEDIVETNGVTSANQYIKGYLDNHNLDKGLSFVSCADDSGYPIYHVDFPTILEIEVGSVLELEINNSYKFGKVVKYQLSDDKEIDGLIQFFDGILQKKGFNAYINTNLSNVNTVFVPSDIAKNFEEFIDVEVSCLARNKKPIQQNQYKWAALQVVKKDARYS